MQFKVNFTNDISLIYDLINHEIVDNWSNLISQQHIINCCEFNHYYGCHNPALLDKRIKRLYELVDIINQHVPNKITKVEFTKEKFHDALNTMHVHFPELERQPEYLYLLKYLSEYNDIIHWLEPTLIDYYNDIKDNSKFSIKLDFNKISTLEKFEIPESAYSLFNEYFEFGQLMLHYVHVGRHAWELFFANDLVCPKDQYVPQSLYNASVRMHFYNNKLETTEAKKRFKELWENYYVARGGKEFFGYDIDDPKIRFGYCQIGTMSSITINDKVIQIPKTTEEISLIRDRLVNSNIIDWEII
jgi:hypothetical protein